MTTEQRAEELESRVGSVEHMNLLLQQSAAAAGGGQGGAATSTAASSFGSQSSSVMAGGGPMPPQPPPRSGRPVPSGQPVAPPVIPSASSFDTSSPPLSGRSTPKVNSHGAGGGRGGQQDPYMHKYHTVRTPSPQAWCLSVSFYFVDHLVVSGTNREIVD